MDTDPLVLIHVVIMSWVTYLYLHFVHGEVGCVQVSLVNVIKFITASLGYVLLKS